jgi:tetratricopeptide (TPR) repeat protein
MIQAHQGKFEDAIAEYQQEIQQQTASVDTYYHLGQAYLLKKDFEAAEQAFRDCLERKPDHRNGLYGLVQALRNQGRGDESREFLGRWRSLRAEESEKLDSLPPRERRDQEKRYTADAYVRAALVYLDTQRVDEALQHFEAALLLHPAHKIAATNWVNVLRQLGRVDRATQVGLRLTEAQPDNVPLLYSVAGLISARNDHQRTAALLEQLLGVQPEHADANREMARLILRTKLRGADSVPEALKHAELAVQHRRSATNLDVLAYALFMSGRKPEAVEALEEAVRLEPDNQAIRQRLEKIRQH